MILPPIPVRPRITAPVCLGLLLLNAGIALAQTAASVDTPQDTDIRIQHGLSLARSGEDQAAMVELEAALAQREDAQALRAMGQIHQKLGHRAEADQYYVRTLAATPALGTHARNQLADKLFLLRLDELDANQWRRTYRRRGTGIGLMVFGSLNLALAAASGLSFLACRYARCELAGALLTGTLAGGAIVGGVLLSAGIPLYIINQRKIDRVRRPLLQGVNLHLGTTTGVSLQF